MSFSEFHSFFEYKSRDILTNGEYKRHLTQCKENGDLWAIEMHSRQNKIQQCIKNVHVLINEIGNTPLGVACKNVMNCAHPPIRIFIGFSKCFITGMQSDKCLDISKNGKKNQEMHIHPKFAYFFLFIWFVCKLEYVIRACAKHWMDNRSCKKRCLGKNKGGIGMTEGVSPSSEQSDVDLFLSENQILMKQLHEVFEKALAYVQTSLDLFKAESLVQPILQPQEEFWKNC